MPYMILGSAASVSSEPEVYDGRTYVPFREVVQRLNGTATWDNASKQATATIGEWEATVNPEDTQVNVRNTTNGNVTPVTLNGTPRLSEDGELWVPASFFQTAYGYAVNISGQNITISNPNG